MHLIGSILPADIIRLLQFFNTMFGSADWKRHTRTDNKNFSLLFEAIDPFHRLIIEIIAAAKRPHERRIFVICRLRQPEIARFLAVARLDGSAQRRIFYSHLSDARNGMLSVQPPSRSFIPPTSTIWDTYGRDAVARKYSTSLNISLISRYSAFPVSTLLHAT